MHDVRRDLVRLEGGDIRTGGKFLIGSYHRGDVGRVERGNIRAAGRFGVGRNIRHNPCGREGRFVSAFRHLGVLRDEGFHFGLLGGGVLRVLISADDRFRGDRAGIGGELVPARLRARHIEIGGNLKRFLRERLIEHAVQTGQVSLDETDVVRDTRKLIHLRSEVDVGEERLYLRFAHAAVHQGLDLRHQRQVLGE